MTTAASAVNTSEVTVPQAVPPRPASAPAVVLPQAKVVSEADCGAGRGPVEPQPLPSQQQQQQRQQAAFDPRAAAVPLGQAVTRTKPAAGPAFSLPDARPRQQAVAGNARSGSLHAPLLPVRPDPGGKAPRSGARKSAEPEPTVHEPGVAVPAAEATAVSQERSMGVSAHEPSEQAAVLINAEAAKAADADADLVSELPATEQQPASPRAEAATPGIPALGATERHEAAEAATAPVALPAAVSRALGDSDAAAIGRAFGGEARALHAPGKMDRNTRLSDRHHDQHDGPSAGAKRLRQVVLGDSNSSLAAEERPCKRQDSVATSSAGGGSIDVAAAMSVLLQVWPVEEIGGVCVLAHVSSCIGCASAAGTHHSILSAMSAVLLKAANARVTPSLLLTA